MKKKYILLSLFMLLYGSAYAENNVYTITWQNCLQDTLRHHPDLISAREHIKASKATKGIARSVLLPQISSNASISGTKNDRETYSSYSAGLSAEQLIFDGMQSVNSYLKAGADIDAAFYAYLVTESNTLYTARIAFINLLKAQEYISIAEAIAKRRIANHKLVKMRYEAGREHLGSVLSAEADMENARADLNEARRDLLLKQKILLAAMGMPETSDIVRAQGTMEGTIDLIQKPDCNKVTKNNPILKKMISLKKSAEYEKKSSYGNYSPQLYAFMNAGINGRDWQEGEKVISGGIKMNLPLFDGLKTYYGTQRAEAQYRQAVSDERSTRIHVLITLEEKWSNLLTKKEKLRVQLKYYKAIKERAKIAESQYSIGIISFDNWTIIEESLVSTMQKYLEARANLLYAETEWIQAKGEIYDTKK